MTEHNLFSPRLYCSWLRSINQFPISEVYNIVLEYNFIDHLKTCSGQ